MVVGDARRRGEAPAQVITMNGLSSSVALMQSACAFASVVAASAAPPCCLDHVEVDLAAVDAAALVDHLGERLEHVDLVTEVEPVALW